MPSIDDKEFGSIIVRRHAKSRAIRIRMRPDGLMAVSAPLYTPLFVIRRTLQASRIHLRSLREKHSESIDTYVDGMQIGKTHSLIARTGDSIRITRHGQQITVTLPNDKDLNDSDVLTHLRPHVQKALRKEAKSYLPRRLSYLASQHDYSYQTVRFSHAGSRWGSCSSNGTISLNIALMKLPFELIDYVLIHELAHTREMNHSQSFWSHVADADPSYRQHRTTLKQHTPAI